MNSSTLTFLSMLVVAGFAQGVTADKPTIISLKGDELFLQEGDELKIVCQGVGDLKIVRQALTGEYERSTETIARNVVKGEISLKIPKTVKEDAGWYACAKESTRFQNDEQTVLHPNGNISWIYVWIKSREPFALMHDSDGPMVYVVTGKDVVIPCRPTSSNVNVKILMNGKTIEEDAENVFDPKIGMIMKNMTLSKVDHLNNHVMCTGGDTNNGPMYILQVQPEVDLNDLYLQTDTLIHVVWGKNATLKCNITTDPHGTPIIWDWVVPDLLPEDRWTMSDHSVDEDGMMVWITTLTIINVEKNYGGDYACVCNFRGAAEKRRVSLPVVIWDPNYTYINVTLSENTTTISVDEHDKATWRFKIESYPIATWTWYEENGKEIEVTGRYNHVVDDDIIHVFEISSVNINDTGNYTVRLVTPNNTRDVVLDLNVKVRPFIEGFNTSLPFYKPGDEAVITCRSRGSPIPNGIWTFAEWQNENETCREECPTVIQRDEKFKSIFTLQSRHEFKVTAMGNVTFKSCNVVGCDEVSIPIYVSDGNGFFGIIEPESLIEGDNVSLICAASVYNYTDDIEWTRKDSEDLKGKNLTAGMTFKRDSTRFTKRSVIEIPKLNKSHAGNYSCRVRTKDDNTETDYYYLSVESTMKPKINTGGMKSTEIEINPETYNSSAITLICNVVGKPKPRITWWKNGDRVRNEQGHFSLSNDNFVLNITEKRLREIHGGEYKCVANNRVGSKEQTYKVTILEKKDYTVVWISLLSLLIVVTVILITYMCIKTHRERLLRIELHKAGLTHFVEGATECLNFDLTIDEQAELLPYDKKWEFPKENLKLGKQLGSGAFGVVMKAEARGICVEGEVTTVAVKMVRRSADPSYMKALSSELKIMIHLGRHLNVVNLLGACTEYLFTKRELYVIVEYCCFGNIYNYLQRHRESFVDQIDPVTQKIDSNIGMERLVRRESTASQKRMRYANVQFSRSLSVASSESRSGGDLITYRQSTDPDDVNMYPDGGVLSNNSVQPGWRSNYRGDYKDKNSVPISTQDLLCWAWQVARGMEYLSARKVLHGDLAARNILLADDNIVKICDFGLAKNMYKDNNYTKKGEGPLPIKWMAIESIRDRMFSTQSDVWSYGIVLWEFFTLARTPYPGMEAEKQYDKLIEGYRMEKPEYATDEIYDFMLHCWKAKPSLRPTFPELAERIGTLLNESIKMHYVDLNTPYIDMNTAAFENGKNDYLAMMSSPNHDYHNAPEPMLQARRPDSAYLSMSPLNKSMEPGIFSPRSELEESHFSFPSPSANSPITSDTEDCVEAVPMLINDDPYLKPIDVKQRRAEFVKQSKAEAPIERDSGYCNVSSNPHFAKANDQSSDPINNLDKNSNPNEQNENNVKYTSPIIHGQDNYVNMPQQKNNRAKDAVLDSFSNPSYVIMSKLEDDRQFV